MILLIGLTVIAVLLVVQNTLSLLIAIYSWSQFFIQTRSLWRCFGNCFDFVLNCNFINRALHGSYNVPYKTKS
ncbi:hypothetical protein BDFB_013250, partial [Asbolus verrucosus]